MVLKKGLSRAKSRGFTLIELLVVISVIGILVSILASSFTTSQKRSRDTKRRADLQAVQKSLEQCFVLNGLYPTAAQVVSGSGLTCGTQTTMNQVPLDPKNTGTYVYTYSVTVDQDGYCYCALLEQTGGGNANTAGGGGACSLTAGDYQCVSNQQ